MIKNKTHRYGPTPMDASKYIMRYVKHYHDRKGDWPTAAMMARRLDMTAGDIYEIINSHDLPIQVQKVNAVSYKLVLEEEINA